MLRVAILCAIVASALAKTPNEKLKECCATLKEADKECVNKFCDFNAISQTNAKGVEGKCLEYCSAHDGVPTNYLDYLFCVESFNEIRDCFMDHLSKNPAFKKG
ncbi:DB module [Oesophagostomum dentatum]|uniref:DB module n=1 Tax=Oesophagostomum dentatum TaxID=61180 RepID=A0A0B1TE29_OESDE|nr:DB module [Oesophagostomum dentatum]